MALISITADELKDLNFSEGASGQWYRTHARGNGDPSDNHTHLIGRNWSDGYDPSRRGSGIAKLEVEKVEFKIRCTGRGIMRVWLVRMTEGEFKLPIFAAIHGLNQEEREIARALYDVLPSKIRAE
ncbi:MAG: hypothetical protein WCP77_22310 [Roseococcus sp.]